jgi:putative cell wall-binding protein/peptidoglycan/xylan/chitin deacetylase (PgdA/CDA1 family)
MGPRIVRGIMQRVIRVVVSLLLVLASVSLTGAASPPAPANAAPLAAGNLAFRVDRLSGADRYATAAAVSRAVFAPGVPVAYVATGQGFPDGLSAGPAAARLGAPVLFTAPTWIPAPTSTELQRLRPGRIVVVGGTGAISESVRAQLAALSAGGASRLAGADRYATAAAVVHDAFASASVVYVATGEAFPDALSGGAGAAAQGAPLLLVRGSSIPGPTVTELQRLRPSTIVVVGGTGVVSAAVESALHAYAPTVVRRAGLDRYATAASVSAYAFPDGAPAAFVATGLNFPDALGGIAAAATQRAPVLLVRGTTIPASIGGELSRLGPDHAFLLGGEAVVGIGVAKTVQRLFGVCWSGEKPAAGSAQVLTRIPDAPNQVALTFDMGGRLTPALDIIGFLVENQVCATIFPTGATSQTAEGAAVLAAIRAHPELFEVGNHTVNHCHLVVGGDGSRCPSSPPSDAVIVQELTGAEAIISAGFGQSTKPYWRPPYGESDAHVRAVAASAGYTRTFMWDIDTIDWDPGTTASQIVARVVPNAVSGSIVLMHLGGYATLDALPSVVSQLRSRGFQLTTASDMVD